MTTIIFDVDGVILDSVRRMYDTTNMTLKEFGLGPISFDKFRDAYNPADWENMFQKFGIKKDQVDEYIKRYRASEHKLPPPKLIPPRNLFRFLKVQKGIELHVLSVQSEKKIKERFHDLGILHYFTEIVSCPKGGKGDDLIKLVNQSPAPCYFVGDSVSDMEAVTIARRHKVDVKFVGVVHTAFGFSMRKEYHISTTKALKAAICPRKGDFLVSKLTTLARMARNKEL